MKKLFYFISMIVLFLINVLAQNFEGEIKMTVTSGIDKADLTFFIKDNNSKISAESSEGKVDIIFDKINNKLYMVMSIQKMYMEFPLEDLRETYQIDSLENDNKNILPLKTGKTKLIAGYECEEFFFEDTDEKVTLWISKENIPFFGFGNPMGTDKKGKKYEQLFSMFHGFPMEVISISSDDSLEMKMEVTSVMKKTINDSEFSIPSDFIKFDMPNLDPNKK